MLSISRSQKRATPSWFSSNPNTAWAEKFCLIYSPLWIFAVAFVQLSGWMMRWGDAMYMAFGVAVALPLVVWPLLRSPETDAPFFQRHWVKFNLWIAIYVWIGSYFLTFYFFDVLGMHYQFPTQWNVQAALVGRDHGEVPLFLYPLTQAYFVTYHVVMVMLYRRARPLLPRHWSAGALLVLVLAYGVAFLETLTMANELLSDFFWYNDRAHMLAYGSLFYSSYFVVSLPLIYRLDETRDDASWPLSRVLLEALAAGMLVFILLDAWTWLLEGGLGKYGGF